MKTKVMQVGAGERFLVAADRAKQTSLECDGIVQFKFNGVVCCVHKSTNVEWLWRDYMNAHLMKWESIGPNCVPKYDLKNRLEIKKRTEAQEMEISRERAEYYKKCDEQRAKVEALISGVDIDLYDTDGWLKSREANTDGYGKAALDYAETWARLMQVELAKGNTIKKCCEYTQNDLGYFVITGFQFVCGRSLLYQTWKHGQELRLAYKG